MYIDYKIDVISRMDNRTIVEAWVYIGDFQDVERLNIITGEIGIINQYIRDEIIGSVFIEVQDPCTDDEIRASLNEELTIFRDEDYPDHQLLPEQQFYE